MKKRMGRPIVPVTIWTIEGRSHRVRALFDSGSEHTIVRESALPEGANISRFPTPRELTTAGPRPLTALGMIPLEIELGGRWFDCAALVAASFPRPLVIGAGPMQMWHISIVNRRDGKTRVVVGLDLKDPDVNTVI